MSTPTAPIDGMDIDVQSNRLTQSRRSTCSSPSGQPAVPYSLSPTQSLPTLVSNASHMRPKSKGGFPAMAPTSPTSHTLPEALKLGEHVEADPVKDTERATPSTFEIIPPPFGDPKSTPTAPQDLALVPLPPQPSLLPPPPHGPLPPDMHFITDGTQITRSNKNAEKLYHRFINDWGGFVGIQDEITRLRLQVQEHRIALQRYRKNVSDCDRVFWDELRKSWAEGLASDDPKLVELYESSQAARDKVGPAEDDYEKMELKLGGVEYSLKRKFEDLQQSYKRYFQLLELQIGSTTHAPKSEISYINSVGADEEREPRNISKLHGANFGDGVKVGGLPAREVISPVPAQQKDNAPIDSSLSASPSPVLDRRNSTIITAEDRAKMRAEDDHFFLEFSAGESRSPKFWAEPQVIVDNLRGIGELPPILEGREVDDSPTNVFEDGKGLLLLGHDIDTRSTLSDYLMEFDSTTTRVNRWLLHKLRISPWEVFELQREVAASSGIVPSWAQLALKLWEQDLDEIGFDYRETSSEEGSLDQLISSATPPCPRPGDSRKRRKRDSHSLRSVPIRSLTNHDLDDTVMKFRDRDVSVTNSAPPESLENFPQ